MLELIGSFEAHCATKLESFFNTLSSVHLSPAGSFPTLILSDT